MNNDDLYLYLNQTSTHLPVHADGTEVEYGCSAQHHIHGHQAITYQHVQGPNSTLKLHTHTL